RNKNQFKIIDHQMGQFLFNINPISYKKNDSELVIKGIAIYSGQDKYSQAFDTLITGIPGINIYYGTLNSSGKLKVKQIGKADCNGVFDIQIKITPNGYLILSKNGLNTTGINSNLFFANYDSVYHGSVIIKFPCK
ncbi:MAG TPA: hypothetical protein PLC65_02085, partial [Bacteroidia bacterium]|nr:hypothetical protein [Bacteroidia bacterium]